MRAGALLLCAGTSSRMGQNKLLMDINGKTPIERSLEALIACREVERLVVVVSDSTEAHARAALKNMGIENAEVVHGGETRQQSVYNGLIALTGCDIAAIHDAARCLVSPEDICATIKSAAEFGSGVAGYKAVDTVKIETREGLVSPDRERVWCAATPQTFSYELIKSAYERAIAQNAQTTDDAQVAALYGANVKMVRCAHPNPKLTYPEDAARFIALTQEREAPSIRVGTGFDAHRLVENRRLVLCGEEIPYEKGLLGHSDADAATHALCDALLGALALGDIGARFPDSDERYKDINSIELLIEVNRMLKLRGWRLSNADITITAQQPRLAPYISRMRANLAAALETTPDRISVKATTTEKMGYEGRGEGISAFASALIAK